MMCTASLYAAWECETLHACKKEIWTSQMAPALLVDSWSRGTTGMRQGMHTVAKRKDDRTAHPHFFPQVMQGRRDHAMALPRASIDALEDAHRVRFARPCLPVRQNAAIVAIQHVPHHPRAGIMVSGALYSEHVGAARCRLTGHAHGHRNLAQTRGRMHSPSSASGTGPRQGCVT
jgi:hypothetical protein